MRLLDEIIFPALLYCGCKIWQFYQGIGLAVYLPAAPEPDDSGAKGRTQLFIRERRFLKLTEDGVWLLNGKPCSRNISKVVNA